MKYTFDDDLDYEDVAHRHPGKPADEHLRRHGNSRHRDKRARTSGKWSRDDWNESEHRVGRRKTGQARKVTRDGARWH